jgi:hypothetical protein
MQYWSERNPFSELTRCSAIHSTSLLAIITKHEYTTL